MARPSRKMEAYYDTECDECGGFIMEGDDFHFVDGDKWCPSCVEELEWKNKPVIHRSDCEPESDRRTVTEPPVDAANIPSPPVDAGREENNVNDPFAQEGGLPSVSFGGRDQHNQITSKPVGYTVKLEVTKAPSLVQSRKYGGTELLFWDPNKKGQKTTVANDQPCMSVVLHGKVLADSLGEDIGVEKALWAQKPSNLFIGIGNAIKEANLGEGGIQVGCIIEISLTGFKQGEDQSKAAAKQYKVTVWPANAFASPAPAGPAGPPPPPAAAPAGPPPPPAAPAAPVLVDGYDKAGYIAAGWTEEAMKAEARFAPFFQAPAPAPAPAGPAGPPPPPTAAAVEDPAAKRAAALANMSDEDKKALGLA